MDPLSPMRLFHGFNTLGTLAIGYWADTLDCESHSWCQLRLSGYILGLSGAPAQVCQALPLHLRLHLELCLQPLQISPARMPRHHFQRQIATIY